MMDQFYHPLIFRDDIRLETPHPHVLGNSDEVVEDHGTHSLTLPVVLNDHGKLRESCLRIGVKLRRCDDTLLTLGCIYCHHGYGGLMIRIHEKDVFILRYIVHHLPIAEVASTH